MESFKGKVDKVWTAQVKGKTVYNFTLDSTGPGSTYSIWQHEVREGSVVEVEAEFYKADGGKMRWNAKKINNLEVPAQQEQPAQKPQALKGEFRSPDEMKRSSALASAVNLIKDSDFENMTLDAVISSTLHVAKHFTYFLSSGQVHQSLTKGGTDE